MSLNLDIPTKSLSAETTITEVIQSMLFGLGDCNKPLLSTAKIIESIVMRQMVALLEQADDVATRRCSPKIDIQDIVFLMRKDKTKLNRLLYVIDFKDSKSWSDQSDVEQTAKDLTKPKPPKRKEKCLLFLKSVGVTDVCDSSQDDYITLERKIRNDNTAENLSISNGDYGEFVTSRSISFFNKENKAKLFDALKKLAPVPMAKLKSSTEDFVSFLAKDTIASVIDLALLVRQDKSVVPGDPFSRAQSQYQVDRIPAITPDEVKEVIRRYFSNQLCPSGLLSRSTTSYVDRFLLAC